MKKNSVFADTKEPYSSRIKIDGDNFSFCIDLLDLRIIYLNQHFSKVRLKECLNAVAKVYIELYLAIELSKPLINKPQALRACHDDCIIS